MTIPKDPLPPIARVCTFAIAFGTSLTGALTTGLVSEAEAVSMNGTAKCYVLPTTPTPAAEAASFTQETTWCYARLDSPAEARWIYSVDDYGRTRPELSMIVERDGTVTHASLHQGELSVHRLKTDGSYNPLNVPLDPPTDAKPARVPITPQAMETHERSLEILANASVPTANIRISNGNFSSQVNEEKLPWRGYWYPYSSGRLHRGANSTMAKWDLFVKARTGSLVGAQRWESRRHGYTGTPWEGHCNGWAAASTLRKEPREPWTDPLSGVNFSIADHKGLLIERDYCATFAFFGDRFMGLPRQNQRDIAPVLFHNTVVYYLGYLKKPLLMDYMSSPPVENSAVSGYQMKIKHLGKNTYQIDATLRVHNYDNKLTDEVGPAPFKDRLYRYQIQTDENGTPIKGAWLSRNPDFFWVALGAGECKAGNPWVRESWIESIGKPLSVPVW